MRAWLLNITIFLVDWNLKAYWKWKSEDQDSKISASPFTNYTNLGKGLNLFEPQFSHP